MKRTFSVYGIAYLVLLLIVLGVLYIYPKLELHLLLNTYHSDVQDTFFKYFTLLAEGPLYVLALIPLFWKKYRITLYYALCEASGAVVIQILKHTVKAPRPISAFEHVQDVTLPLVEGVKLHHSNSFPSGHASTFFIFTTCCALLLAYYYAQSAQQNSRKTWLVNLSMVSLLLLAALGGYSRIYLSQHFLSDVCVGSIIGFVMPCLIFYLGRNKILKLKTE